VPSRIYFVFKLINNNLLYPTGEDYSLPEKNKYLYFVTKF